MKRAYVTSTMLFLLAFGAAACSTATETGSQPGAAAADAPLVAPPTPNTGSGSTLNRQEKSGYYPDADAPLVPPNDTSGNPAATQSDQKRSGYFPDAGAPLVPPNTMQPQ
ncbi:MAG: hypothetical protein ACLQJR_28900 [Stellaceae bacterium]